MNEKIKELFGIATFEEERLIHGMYHPYIPLQKGGEFRFGVTQKQYHKFAELIIKDCLNITAQFEKSTIGASITEQIKDHFGIE